jgi:hypothetical protein
VAKGRRNFRRASRLNQNSSLYFLRCFTRASIRFAVFIDCPSACRTLSRHREVFKSKIEFAR